MKNPLPGQKPPAHLSAASKKLWKQITEGWELDESGLLILQQALESYDRIREAQKAIRAHGLLVANERGALSANPALRVERDARTLLLRAWRQLALDLDPPGPIGRPPGGRRR
ncbi:MAG: P27 family phage terminase small subunit [Thermodesulfobacteriota bacterium]|jgi:P27 family predicted phage terminase small subunit